MGDVTLLTFVLLVGILLHSNAQDIRHPPNIITPVFTRTIYFRDGSPFNISCRAEGEPKPRYTWKRNEKNITSTSIIIDQGDLRVEKATSEEAGVYRCLASNTWGTAVSYDINMLQIEDNYFKTDVLKVVTVDRGNNASLACRNPPHMVPAGILSWYTKIGSDAQSLQSDERVGVDEKGTLHFAYVLEEDQLVGGVYSCSIQNLFLPEIKLGSETELEVKPAAEIHQSKPRSRYTSDTKQAFVGINATLECFFSGNPVPSISWYDNNNEIVGPNHQRIKLKDFNRKLVISKVKESDEGKYRCIGKNTIGQTEEDLYLNVTSRPIWKQPPKSQTVIEGTNVTFSCLTRAANDDEPPSAPVWFQNGEPLSPKDTRIVGQTTFQVLRTSRDDDIMNVQCVVKNELGRVFQDAYLNVLLPIQITNQPPSVIKVEQGDLVNLTVSAISDPSESLVYTWKQERAAIGLPRQGYWRSDDHRTLTIRTSALTRLQMEEMFGLYSCLVSHNHEKRIVSVLLRKPEIDPTIKLLQQPASDIQMDYDDVVNLTVLARTDPSLSLNYMWTLEGGEVRSRDGLSLSEDSTTLTVNTSQLPHDEMDTLLGRYICVVSNNMTQMDVIVTLKFVNSPNKGGIGTVKASSNLWVIAIVCGLILVIAAVLLVVFVLRHRYPKRVYLLEKKELKNRLDPVRDLEHDGFQTL